MPTVVGVRLRFASKTLWFDPAGATPTPGDHVIVETERGTEFGTVMQAPFDVPAAELPAALKPVLRIATEEDIEHEEELERAEAEAMPVFRQLVEERKLDMKPVNAEYLFDGDKIIFYFSAEERVDFRELVRDLASRFHARIDLRQIGVRDEARLVGGVGHCGQQLCCVRFSGDFQPVSIRMAKEQDLPLNPLKISGLCGRLMCCLRYEFDAYKDFKSRAPKRGAFVETPAGDAKVTDLNTPRETVTMRFGDGNTMTVPLSGMECSKGCNCPCKVTDDAFTAAAPSALLPSPEPEFVESEPETEASETAREPRRRRRRSRGGGDKGGGEAGQQPQQKAKQAQPKPAQKQESEGKDAGKKESSGTAEGAGRSGKPRRRRRRKRSGGGDAPTGS
ncbi:MAG: stage 0 sporulation family protein [Coriobacteriales bacterium]|nr:stage 0 sporulation family protein [Coriobacteriales bacterium]